MLQNLRYLMVIIRSVMNLENAPKKSVELPSLTPKAFANLSPGFERSENPGLEKRTALKP